MRAHSKWSLPGVGILNYASRVEGEAEALSGVSSAHEQVEGAFLEPENFHSAHKLHSDDQGYQVLHGAWRGRQAS